MHTVTPCAPVGAKNTAPSVSVVNLKSLQSSDKTMRTHTHTCYIMLGSLASHWSDLVTERSDWLGMTTDCDEQNWSKLETIVATTGRVSLVPICVSDDDVMISQRPVRVGTQSQQQTRKQHLDNNVGSRESGSAEN